MKNIYKIQWLVSVIICIILLTACKSNQIKDKETIQIEQLSTDYPVSFIKNKDDNQIFRIFFRIPFEITNRIPKTYSITLVDYFYSDQYGKPYLNIITKGWSSCILYNSNNNERITDSHIEFNKNNPAYIYIYIQDIMLIQSQKFNQN